MAEYKGIFGTKIQNLTSDPANPITGQVWYNETSQTMKVEAVTTVGAWATGGNMNTARTGGGSAGTSNSSALAFGGELPANTAVTESYDGTSWTELNDLNSARRYLAGAGTQTSALAFGGFYDPGGQSALTETWNGTSWTEVNDLNTARYFISGAGSDNTNAIATGGEAPAFTNAAETWNGTNWTNIANMNTTRASGGTVGTATLALAFGGLPSFPGTQTANTETWNGSSWTEVNNLNTARLRVATAGTQPSALCISGALMPDTRVANVEEWNGTSWAEVADVSTAVQNSMGNSTSTSSAIKSGGDAPPITNVTEEWTGAGAPQVRTITSS
jgi:hypothetical protein